MVDTADWRCQCACVERIVSRLRCSARRRRVSRYIQKFFFFFSENKQLIVEYIAGDFALEGNTARYASGSSIIRWPAGGHLVHVLLVNETSIYFWFFVCLCKILIVFCFLNINR